MSKPLQCSECGGLNGSHFTGCPEDVADERDDEPKVDFEPDDDRGYLPDNTA